MANNFLGGNRQTSNSRFLRLLQANRNLNTGTTTGGLAHVLNMAARGYASGVDRNQETASNEAMSKAAALMQGTNPRVLAAPSVASNLGDDEDETLGQGITIPGVAPDMQGAISVLSNNPKFAPLAMQLQMGENAKKEAAATKIADYNRKRADIISDNKAKRDHELLVARAKPQEMPNSYKEYLRAIGPGGGFNARNYTYDDHMKRQKLLPFGMDWRPDQASAQLRAQSPAPWAGQRPPTPRPTRQPVIIPGGPADMRAKSAAARIKTNSLAQERINQVEKRDDPAYIARLKRQDKKIALDIKNEAAQPSRRNAILSRIERAPLLKKSIDLVLAYTKDGWMTSGTLGQIAAFSSDSDQYKKIAAIKHIRSMVGIKELIDAKKQGATFGALSDSELEVLVSAMGALDPNLGYDELKPTLDRIYELYNKSIERNVADYKGMYKQSYDVPPGFTEADIITTMQENGMTRKQVISRLMKVN